MTITTTTTTPVGPQYVGGRYLCGYWQDSYEVLAINGAGTPCWSITVRWSDGHTGTHCTAWDSKRDRVLSQPVS